MAGLLALRERGDLGDGPVLYVNTHGSRAAAVASSHEANVSTR